MPRSDDVVSPDAASAAGRSRTGPLHSIALPTRFLIVTGLALGAGLLARDWIAGLGLLVLWAGWHWLVVDDTPPVLAMAFTFQWVQVTIGLYYHALSGRSLEAIELSDYRPMVLIGLGCLVALLAGLKLGLRLLPGPREADRRGPAEVFTWFELIAIYLVSIGVTGTVQQLAWEVPLLTQGILALTYARLATLFIMFYRLTRPRIRWGWIGLILAIEVGIGFTGFFAGFREPLMMAAVALLTAFNRRKFTHWAVLGVVAITMFGSGLMWMAIRTDYRQDFENQVFAHSREARLERVIALTSSWLRKDFEALAYDLDFFVDRLWAVYYPALAVARVPSALPHEDGAILGRALAHLVTPRLFFPDKAVLESDSEMVMRYSGVWAAGAERETSIAFGYAAESYVDFGVPLMFLPVLVFGLLMGLAYHFWLRAIRNRELAVGFVTATFWMCLYLFERSWIKTLGLTVTMMVYLGGATFLLDRFLLWRDAGSAMRRAPARAAAPRRAGG
jgi:hypothetical protein